jgi:rare lipoprotein A
MFIAVILLCVLFSFPSLAEEQVMRALCYGPGFYGHKTANGTRLTKELVGVAHKTLKLGTPLTLKYKGKEVAAKVIDRGPYSGGADLDLTEATVRSLGFKNCWDFGARKLSVTKGGNIVEAKNVPAVKPLPEIAETKAELKDNKQSESGEKIAVIEEAKLDNPLEKTIEQNNQEKKTSP